MQTLEKQPQPVFTGNANVELCYSKDLEVFSMNIHTDGMDIRYWIAKKEKANIIADIEKGNWVFEYENDRLVYYVPVNV